MRDKLPSESPARVARRFLRNTLRLAAGPLLLLQVARIASAQEESRDSLTSDAALQARAVQVETQPYTIKEGDFRLLIAPQLGLEYNSNIRISSQNEQQDFILNPALQLTASYPIGKRNLLTLDATVGYDAYLDHPQYSTFTLVSGSQLSFDLYAGDYWFNLHDRFSYTQDPGTVAALANTARYGGFDNTIGLSVTRDFRDVIPTIGYDHHNFISSSSDYDYVNSNAELLSGRVGFQLHPTVTAGAEANASFTTYDQPVLNDNTGASGGAYVDWKPGHYLRVQGRGGYTAYLFDQTSYYVRAVDQDAWYLGLTVSHDITEAISYSVSGGHELRLGLQSDTIEAWYCRANVSWKLIKNLTFTTGFSYENGTQGGTGVNRTIEENYDWFTWNLGLRHPITKRLAASLDYRLTLRASNLTARDYTQNVLGLRVTYSMQ